MPEDVLFKTEEPMSRSEIARRLEDAANQIQDGTVRLSDGAQEQTTEVPSEPLFEVELERLTDSETGERRFELEYEIRWTE